jgi:hypothetical protein
MLLPNLLNLQIEEMLSLSSWISSLWKLREATNTLWFNGYMVFSGSRERCCDNVMCSGQRRSS